MKRPIIGKFEHQAGGYLRLRFNNDTTTVSVTGTHPFWSEDRDMWVKAQELNIGENLKTQYGTAILTQRQTLETKTTVYNLEVYQDHNYLVSEDRLLVHNNGCGQKAGNYNDLNYDGSKQHVHNMPSRKATGTKDGLAIVMDKADHYETGSFGGGSRADYKGAQSDLIDGGNYRGAFEMDMKDIRDKFGPKYEKRIRQAAKYAAKQGLL